MNIKKKTYKDTYYYQYFRFKSELKLVLSNIYFILKKFSGKTTDSPTPFHPPPAKEWGVPKLQPTALFALNPGLQITGIPRSGGK